LVIFKFFPRGKGFFLVLAAVFFLGAFSGCAARENIQFERQDLVLQGAGGPVALKAELARTEDQRRLGLMFRKELKDGEGMLFIFAQDQILAFWMKNTLIPLSIAFIASDGRILEIRELEPGNLQTVKSGRSCRYALEVPRGWFDRAGLGPGDRLVSFPDSPRH
jgi:uncharacterized membrane protein (UPF0127 family)